jgi:hypothetical protein
MMTPKSGLEIASDHPRLNIVIFIVAEKVQRKPKNIIVLPFVFLQVAEVVFVADLTLDPWKKQAGPLLHF